MTSQVSRAIMRRLRRRPGPRFLVNLFLAIRWHCRIHPGADIQFPLQCCFSRGAQIGRCTIIGRGRPPFPILIGRAHIHDGAFLDALDGFIEIGDGTTVNPYCVLYGTGGLTIGSNCGIATHTCMVTANHRFEAVDIPIMHQGIRAVGISISDDVWIGAGCILLDGVIVGSGSVIAAGAVVSKSIPPMAVAAGVPARVLRYRDSRE